MHRSFSLFLISACTSALANAQAEDPWVDATDTWTVTPAFEAALVGASEGEGAALRFDFSADATRVLSNGVELSAVLLVGLEKEAAERAGFTGGLGGGIPFAPQGPFSGLSRAAPDETGGRLQLERAYVVVTGGYGQARLGRDKGLAARFAVPVPSAFTHLRTGSARLDPTGGDFIRTDHDLTGPALKASMTTPRLLGLQAGASYTPQADVAGLDRDPVRDVPGAVRPDLEDALELSLNLSRRLSQSGLSFEAAVGWSRADAEAPSGLPVFEPVETWSASGTVQAGRAAFGASAVASESAFAGAAADYTAYALGATYSLEKTTFGLEYGWAEDDLTGLESESLTLGASRPLNDYIRAGIGWRDQNTSSTGILGAAPLNTGGIVIEITLSG